MYAHPLATYYIVVVYLLFVYHEFTGKCPSSSAAGETTPPAGFVYNKPADKYYSWSSDLVARTWYAAQVQCSAREATLIEGTTAEEHDVFPVMRSTICPPKAISIPFFNKSRGVLQAISTWICGQGISTLKE